MCSDTVGGMVVLPAASLVDKDKPDASRGRKATGPTRSAGLPNRKNKSCASPPNSSAVSPLPAIEMSILVACANKHGATGGTAERIAEGLRAAGQPADALDVKDKTALNVMKVQRNAARDELRALKAQGLSPEQITALTKKPEGDSPDIEAITATARREANTAAGFGHVPRAGGLLHISNSRPATR
jgi:hypothetical protein